MKKRPTTPAPDSWTDRYNRNREKIKALPEHLQASLNKALGIEEKEKKSLLPHDAPAGPLPAGASLPRQPLSDLLKTCGARSLLSFLEGNQFWTFKEEEKRILAQRLGIERENLVTWRNLLKSGDRTALQALEGKRTSSGASSPPSGHSPSAPASTPGA
jgi:hypothetical protein